MLSSAPKNHELFRKHTKTAADIRKYEFDTYKNNRNNSNAQNEISKAIKKESDLADKYFHGQEQTVISYGKELVNVVKKIYNSTPVNTIKSFLPKETVQAVDALFDYVFKSFDEHS